MNQVTIKRWRQVLCFGWQDAKDISSEAKNGPIVIYTDIISCFIHYHLFSNQYRKFRFWELSESERKKLGEKLGEVNRKGDIWLADNYRKWRFAAKWGDKRYEATPSGQQKRKRAYTKEFQTGINLIVQYNVQINREHYLDGTISIGNNVTIARNAIIDYSGHLIIGDNVGISAGVVIETHEHLGYTNPNIDIHYARQKNVIIEDGVTIGVKAIINASVGRIGRNARIAAGAVLRHSVPPYAIVAGNPAKIVGFSMTPEQVADYEKEKYKEEDRISIEQYEKDYNKYFLERMDEIKLYVRK